MKCYSLSHAADHEVRRGLHASIVAERANTADILAHVAEFDERRLYAPEAYPSTFAYLVGALHLSEDMACKRIRVARKARELPAIFVALAEGRLHLSALVRLAPYLTPETADELLAAAAHKSRAELDLLLAERFPQPDLPASVQSLEAPGSARDTPAQVVVIPSQVSAPGRMNLEDEARGQGQPEPAETRSKLEARSPGRFAVQFTMDQVMHDDLRYAQDLLGRRGDLADVFGRALRALIRQLEKQKLAATARPRSGTGRSSHDPRYIPAHVRRAVLARDGGRCTFVSEDGRRCEATSGLEWDHILEVARGGRPTVDGIRLRCRAHNQYTAERAFGREFMRRKRLAAAHTRAEAQAKKAMEAEARAMELDIEQDPDRSVIPWLRHLGARLDEARRAAKLCDGIASAPMQERLRVALSMFRNKGTHVARTAEGTPAAP